MGSNNPPAEGRPEQRVLSMASAQEVQNLCVDLDGTLVRSDTLLELILAAVKASPFVIVKIIFWLLKGKAHFKSRLVEQADLNVKTLPYNDEVCAFLRAQRAEGRRLTLATASHERVAKAIADELGFFDQVIASTEEKNLRGQPKADRLVQEFGEGQFSYAGNDAHDLPVWRHAASAVVVTDSNRFVDQVPIPIEKVFSTGRRPPARAFLKAMRLHQWAKNSLLFVPVLTAHTYNDMSALTSALLAFLAFSLCASGTYIVNDLLDIESDRKHPEKRKRPFAAGDLSPIAGVVGAAVLLIGAFAMSLAFLPDWFTVLLAVYYVTTTFYTFWLKRISTLDVMTLAGLYTLRILAGSAAVSVEPSFWILLFSMFLFLSLAYLKRYIELEQLRQSDSGKVTARGYSIFDTETTFVLGAVTGSVAALVMALYINNPSVAADYRTPELLWFLSLALLYWINRIWVGARRGKIDHDPVVFAVKDKVSLSILVFCVAIVLCARFFDLRVMI